MRSKEQALIDTQTANYIFIITDCGTDISGKDNFIAYCRYISAGVAVNRFRVNVPIKHTSIFELRL